MRSTDKAGRIVVEESNFYIPTGENLLQPWFGEFDEVLLAEEADYIIENENAFDCRERFYLQAKPVNDENL